MEMKRYNLVMIARPEEPGCSERMFKTRARGRNELEARRQVLERAWATGYLISRFLEIKERSEA